MNILVIGGAGYIGSHTVVELAAAGHRPIIVDNFANSSKGVLARLKELTGNDITYYEQDFRDTDALSVILDNEHIDGVIHFAAYKAVGDSVADPLSYYQNNTCGFVDLLGTLLGHDIKNFIFSSSAAVYGNPPEDMITEETRCQPESPYGWSKYMDEVILHDTCNANPDLYGVALRYFNVVGAHPSGRLGEQSKTRPQNLLPVIIQAVEGTIPPLTVLGTDYPTPDGTCLRDYIHVVDLAKAHIAALEKASDKGSFEAYNISTGTPTSVLGLIKTFEAVNEVTVPHSLGERRAGDPASSYAKAEKAATKLGWKAEKTIEDACRDAWHWRTSNPNGYDVS